MVRLPRPRGSNVSVAGRFARVLSGSGSSRSRLKTLSHYCEQGTERSRERSDFAKTTCALPLAIRKADSQRLSFGADRPPARREVRLRAAVQQRKNEYTRTADVRQKADEGATVGMGQGTKSLRSGPLARGA